MSIVNIDREKYPALAAVMEGMERREEAPEYLSESAIEVAREKGRDIIDHFTKFIGYEEDSFKDKLFHVKSDLHQAMHQGFWDEIRSRYPEMVTLDFPDYPFVQQHVFYDIGVALIEQRRFSQDTAELYEVSYSAVRLETERALGTVAAAHLD